MFKKVVIADSLAPIVDGTFNNYQDFGGGTLWMGAIYFGLQIYCDFSGYSDIAIGTSKLFGFELMSNFKFPYFSRNIESFGEGGISRYQLGLGITYIYHLEVQNTEN